MAPVETRDTVGIAAHSAGLRGAEAIGRTETRSGRISIREAAHLGAILRHPSEPPLGSGDVLPLLWHWAAFPDAAPMEALGGDGHPALGTFLPDLSLSRRMWAGGTMQFLKPLHVDADLTRRSEIRNVEHKDSSAGPMAVVTLEHQVSDVQGPAIMETQTIVYLRIPDRFSPPQAIPAPSHPVLDETVLVDPVLLFRYSAVTFNGHRIHYDRDYATQIEHYPGLVTHGPLQATLLADAATRHRGSPPVRFKYRGVRPMFDTHNLRVLAEEGPAGALQLCTAAAPDGPQGMQATAEWDA
ncbi:FAS1-like dehydratase domain-containing protein [Tropicimonas sp. S265A]|uniref:FAS1-like dehydratase domain-containing protein n=1 Tax=Tropicimonas sp. S265A TaxID=3415134 RepID=UPI003C7B5B26